MKKKILILSLIGIFTVVLSGCFKKESEKVKEYLGISQEEMNEELSSDDSLETIEQELEATDVSDFDEELNALDEDIEKL